MTEFPHNEMNTRYLDDLQRARRLANADSVAWTEFRRQVNNRMPFHIEEKYPNIFSDTHKEEICQAVISRLKANNCRVLVEFRGECTLLTYIGRQLGWAIKDWLRKNSDRLYEVQIDPPTEDGHRYSIAFPENVDGGTVDPEPLREEDVFSTINTLPDTWRWAFLLRYYYFFGFPPAELRALAKKRNVPVLTITELLIKYFEVDEGDKIWKHIQRKEKVLESLGRINERIRRLYTEEGSLPSQQGDDEGRRAKIAEQKKELEKKRQLVRKREKHVIRTPHRAIADIMGEASVDTVRGFVSLARKQLQELLKEHKVIIGRQEGMCDD